MTHTLFTKRLLIQTQLSNYDKNGKFTLAADSGWQMVMGRVRQMLKLHPDIKIDVMCPLAEQCVHHPTELNMELWNDHGPHAAGRLNYIEHKIIPNALATRYDFSWEDLTHRLKVSKTSPVKYDVVYINDPMHLRNFKAMFFVAGGYVPRFIVHSHFIDDPTTPKFPTEASLWHGQCEAAIRADWNFWQCSSALDVFRTSMSELYYPNVIRSVMDKSEPWDDGYSSEEVNSVNLKNVRFDPYLLQRLKHDDKKRVIFVPNRIGGMGRSSDYTNCGKFMFEILPKLKSMRSDFVVIAGNPNQKFSNNELQEMCGKDGYVSLVPDTLNRDEYKLVAKTCDLAVGLYDQDSYGGTAARECVDLGATPVWIDKYEYAALARKAGDITWLAKSDLTNVAETVNKLITATNQGDKQLLKWKQSLRSVVVENCSYESTTAKAMRRFFL